MTIKTPPPSIASAAASLLSPYCDGITSEKLVAAIKSFDETPTSMSQPRLGKPMTKKEVACLCHVSVGTINAYIRHGYLKAHKLPRGRLVRISPESVAQLLGCEAKAEKSTPEAVAEVAP